MTETQHDLQRYQKMELLLLEKDRRIRELEAALASNVHLPHRCDLCGGTCC